MMSQLPKVGQNLRRLRNGLGLSLDEASKLTGVSKAMLGQIERGESSPTISTLWKISSGLKVNFTSLLDDNQNELVLVKKEEVEIIEEEKAESSNNSLNGKSFCFTGAMKNKRKDLESKVLDFGGIVHDSIKKNPLTDYLVVADINSTSSKAVAARKLGVLLISEDDFLEMCK